MQLAEETQSDDYKSLYRALKKVEPRKTKKGKVLHNGQSAVSMAKPTFSD